MGSDVPDSVRRLVETWRIEGSPSQAAFLWPRQRWIDRFERHRALLIPLPDALDRPTIRRACVGAAESPETAEAAFMVAMAWGYGTVGFGPWRVARILATNRGAAARLQAAAETLGSHGPMPAYRRLGDPGDCRLRYLGPAFGTKFLAFCSSDRNRPPLILDRLVAAWLGQNAGLDLNPVPWNAHTYSRYLDQMYRWADLLDVSPDDLECRVFSAEADRIGNRWATAARPK
jgi:hypothetical protein